ncbi:hypothetical protein AB4Z52_34250 [Rhizobium sp. 2YAF20]|uniref:hypothetical protein n=1 Tax=Rhizobium sp. 2YAF20 TaxID=3233027 RepID=UPI003F9BCABF
MKFYRPNKSHTLATALILLAFRASAIAQVPADDLTKAFKCVAITAMSLAQDELRTPEQVVGDAMKSCEDLLENASVEEQHDIESASGEPIGRSRAEDIFKNDVETRVEDLVEHARARAKLGIPDIYTYTAKRLAAGQPVE